MRRELRGGRPGLRVPGLRAAGGPGARQGRAEGQEGWGGVGGVELKPRNRRTGSSFLLFARRRVDQTWFPLSGHLGEECRAASRQPIDSSHQSFSPAVGPTPRTTRPLWRSPAAAPPSAPRASGCRSGRHPRSGRPTRCSSGRRRCRCLGPQRNGRRWQPNHLNFRTACRLDSSFGSESYVDQTCIPRKDNIVPLPVRHSAQ